MPKQNDYNLNEDELAEIHAGMKNLEGRMAKRATLIYGLQLGYEPAEGGRLNKVSLATRYKHFKRFKAEGLGGLADKAKSGRPRKATPQYIDCLATTFGNRSP